MSIYCHRAASCLQPTCRCFCRSLCCRTEAAALPLLAACTDAAVRSRFHIEPCSLGP